MGAATAATAAELGARVTVMDVQDPPISSTAGLGWEKRLDLIDEVLGLGDWDAQQRWMDDHPDLESYVFTKQAVRLRLRSRWCAPRARRPHQRGAAGAHRHPTGPRQRRHLAHLRGALPGGGGRPHLVPQQQADGLLFLCSPAASGITGTTLVIDQGLFGAMGAGAYVEQSRAAARN
jgi:hypothetical protein